MFRFFFHVRTFKVIVIVQHENFLTKFWICIFIIIAQILKFVNLYSCFFAGNVQDLDVILPVL